MGLYWPNFSLVFLIHLFLYAGVYCIVNKQRAKVSGMCDFPNSSYWTKGITENYIVFSMEAPCWSPSEGLEHGGRKPVETSGVYFGSLKTFILSVKLENTSIGTYFNILVTQNSKT